MPRLGTKHIRRKRVEEKLAALGQYRFAYIYAPAGYGKTTAIIDYILREKKQYAWFSIEEQDNDSSVFWSYISTSIAQCTGSEDIANISTSDDLVLSNIMVELLINAINTSPVEFVLVLDDYHFIYNTAIRSSVEYFVKYMPKNVNLIVASRKGPEQVVEALCIKGVGFCISAEDLAFSNESTREFFLQKGFQLSEEEIHGIEACTEGWPAGLAAAAFYINHNAESCISLGNMIGKNKSISFFLRSEVFECWPEEVKNFLVKTSFLDKFSGPLCRAVTGNESSEEVLETLYLRNSFIVALDAEHQWFRYHNLFQEFLLARLRQMGESEMRRLYLLAANCFLEQGFLEDALKWLIKAKEYQLCPPIILDVLRYSGSDEIAERHVQLMREWYAVIPKEFFSNYTNIYTWYSWIAFMDNDIEVLQECVRSAKKCMHLLWANANPTEIEHMQVGLIYAEMSQAIFLRNPLDLYNCFNKLRKVKFNNTHIVGDLNWSEPRILNTRYGFMGRLQMVAAYRSVQSEIQPYTGDIAGYLMAIIAESLYEQNQIDQAMEIVVAHMSSIVKRRGALVPAFILMAKIKAIKGDMPGAFSVINDGHRLLEKKNDDFWGYHLKVFEARLHMQLGDIEQLSTCINLDRLSIHDALTCVRENEYLIYSRLLMQMNRLDDASVLLKRLEDFARENDRLTSLMEILCIRAVCQSKKVDFTNALLILKEALVLGSRENYVRVFIDEREPMAVLLERYITQNRNGGIGAHLSYARELLKQINAYIIQSIVPRESKESGKDSIVQLTETELEILRYMKNQASNQQIANDLFLSINTIKKYNARIFDKLGVKNRFEAIQKAKKLGIL